MTEHEQQAAVIEWKHWQLNLGVLPELSLLHAVPNGGWRATATANRLKAEGVEAGVPDLFLPVPRGGFHGLYIEMKDKSTRGAVRPDQWIWIAALRHEGYYVTVCWNSEQAIRMLEIYLSLPKETNNANSEEDLAEADAQAARAKSKQAGAADGAGGSGRRRRRRVRSAPW